MGASIIRREYLANLDHEVKFVLPSAHAAAVRAFLRTACRPDPEHPRGRIASLYYDTPHLDLLADKLDSQYLKTKVRVRWYENPESGLPEGGAFFEVKQRIGSRRTKLRREAPATAAWITSQPLTNADLAALPDLLERHLERALPRPLIPAIVVRYRRERFVERFSGARVALDTSIEAGASHPSFSARPGGRPLGAAVLEVKSTERRLPALLQPLVSLGCRQGSYSKYAACMLEARAAAA